jgi:hypothetical protein
VDYYEQYNIYDLKVISDVLIEAILNSYNPALGSDAEELPEESPGISKLELCGSATNICSGKGKCDTQQGRKICICNDKRFGEICEFSEDEWNKMKTVADKIVNSIADKDPKDDEERLNNSYWLITQ